MDQRRAALPLKYKNHEDLSIKRKALITREEFVQHMTFEKNHAGLYTEIFGPIIGLKEEWEEQGATEEELDFSAFTYRQPLFFEFPVITGRLGESELSLVEENEEFSIHVDNLGRYMKRIFKSASLALPLNNPVKNREDWIRIKHLYEFSDERFLPGWEEISRRALEQGQVLCFRIPGGFDEPRQLMGEEELSYAWYEQPELIIDILETIAATSEQVMDRVCDRFPVDMMRIHEDMAGKSGPLIGPLQIQEFLKPYYKRLWDRIHDRGCRLFDQDSDGNMEAVIQSFIDCGVNCMHPVEPAAGMDIVKLRKLYGKKTAFMGGLDKFAIRDGGERMHKELAYKVPALLESGGVMLGLDHRVVNGTPLENYREYNRLMCKMLHLKE